MRFSDKLRASIARTGSALCVGLDPRPEGADIAATAKFLREVIAQTAPYAAAYKPNIAYFEAMGLSGLQLMADVLKEIPDETPVVLDVKRGDIGETQKYYAKAYFDELGVDAVTLNPFMGYDTLAPFLGYAGKGVYLLAVTSNAGSTDIEKQSLADGRKVYQLVGDMVNRAKADGAATDVGMVVGLTNADSEVLHQLPDAPLLIPGLGAQGGDLSQLTGSGRIAPPLINVSRGVLYANPDMSYADKAAEFAERIRRALNLTR